MTIADRRARIGPIFSGLPPDVGERIWACGAFDGDLSNRLGVHRLLFDSYSGPTNYAGEIYVTGGALASARDGSVVVGDYGRFAVNRITGSSVASAKTFGLNPVPGLPGGFRPSGVAVAPNGVIYAVTDGENGGANVPALLSIDPNGQVRLLDKGVPVPRPK